MIWRERPGARKGPFLLVIQRPLDEADGFGRWLTACYSAPPLLRFRVDVGG